MYKTASMLFLVALSASASAGTLLSGEQIKNLVSGNTVALHSLAKNINFQIYYAADGSSISHNENSGKKSRGTWRITDSGEWCNYWPTEKNPEERCGQVIDNGDGTYNRLENGNLRSVWKKIHTGNTIGE